MINEKFSDFLNSLYTSPEIEHTFRGKTYFLEWWTNKDSTYTITLFICYEKNSLMFEETFPTLRECIEYYKKAKCYEGLTIYQAEKEIEVLFG